MKKILLIIRREYLTRVKKRSFVVMTILGPLLMAALVIVPIYVATMTNESKTIAVIDETGLFFEKFKDSDNIHFHYLTSDINSVKQNFKKSDDYAILYIPKTAVSLPTNAILYSSRQVNINIFSYIKTIMTKQVEELKLEAKLKDLPMPEDKKLTTDDILKSIKASIDITTIKIGEEGKEEKSYPEVTFILGLFGSIMIYFFIFMFGAQVMRGVIEEKTSRIIEVIISSVKPFELMMGKIIGVALVGLTQFLLWVVLTFSIVTAVTATFSGKITSKAATEQVIGSRVPGVIQDQQQPAGTALKQSSQGVNEVLDAINSIDFPLMIG